MRIISTGSAVPKLKVTNEMFSNVIDTSDEWIFSRTGISSRFIADGETAESLAVDAAKAAITAAGIETSDIGLLICASITSEYLTPSLACLVQRDLGLNEDILAFDVNAACSGFIYTLGVAQSLMKSGMMRGKYALLIGSERLSRITNYEDRSTCVLFGDGAGAIIAEPSDGVFEFFTGARGDVEPLRIGAPAAPINPFAQPYKSPAPTIYMDGQAVFKFAVEVMVKSVREVLGKAGKTAEDIAFFVCHQANKRVIKNAAQRLEVPLERFFMNIQTHGNTSAASIPLALAELNSSGRLCRGDDIVFAGFGGGLTYGAVYMAW